MKFKIRYADQIVGIFSLIALVVLLVLVFALGAKQNWFIRKNVFYTEFESGSAIKPGMDINYKGFGIGKIKSIKLEDDKVIVEYYILDSYMNYVRENSLLEFSSNILGLGTSFVFHPGRGVKLIEPGSEIYRYDSREGVRIRNRRLVDNDATGDAITGIINKVEPLLDSVTRLVTDLDIGLRGDSGRGNRGAEGEQRQEHKSELAKIIQNVGEISANIAVLTKDLSRVTARMNGESGAVGPLLGEKGSESLDGILNNLEELLLKVGGLGEQAGELLKDSSPQLDSLLDQVDSLLLELQDVLTGVKNNPLIRNGVPDRSQEKSATPNMRSEDF